MCPATGSSQDLYFRYTRQAEELFSIGTVLQKTGLVDFDLIQRTIFAICLDEAHSLYNLHPTLDSSKYRMFSIEPRSRSKRNEELTSVCIGTTVRHAEYPSSGMFQGWLNLILKFLAVYRRSASTCACWIAALDHEIGNDAMEDDIVVVASLCEGCEVLAGFRSVFGVKFYGNNALPVVRAEK